MVEATASVVGEAYDELDPLRRTAVDHVWVHAANWRDLAARDGLKVFVKGEGIYLTDSDGQTYIDGLSGVWVVNAGHGRREIGQAFADQAATLAYASSFGFTTPPAVELAERLSALAPGDLSRVFFCSGGSEAVESALKIAKQYQALKGYQKRYKIIARRGSYHGATFGAMSVSGARASGRFFEPFMPGVHHAPQPDKDPEAEAIEALIEFEGPETIAAIIAEPISAAAGVIVPGEAYLRRLRELCDKHGIVLIFDEVINGFGRTGTLFACQQWGVTADIMTVAKGLTSGYAPVGAAIVSPKIAEAFVGDDKTTLSHGLTYGGHAASCAAALANLAIFEREGLVENAATVGAYLKAGLEGLTGHPMVKEVRGVGLLLAVALTKDKASGAAWARGEAGPRVLSQKINAHGMVCRLWDILQIAPPLTLTRAEADRIVEIVDRSLTEAEQELGLA